VLHSPARDAASGPAPAYPAPGRPETPGLSRRSNTAFRRSNNVGSRCRSADGAYSHGPCIRCLRFATLIARTPRQTRFRLPAELCRAGFNTRWVPKKVSTHHSASSFSRLFLAQWTCAGWTCAARASRERCILSPSGPAFVIRRTIGGPIDTLPPGSWTCAGNTDERAAFGTPFVH